MTKIRKQKRKQRYRFNVNRKRMNKKKVPNPQSKIVKQAWKEKFSCQQNLKQMGLIYDINKELTQEKKKIVNSAQENINPETKVVEALETEANALRERGYRLPKNQVEYLTYLIDKYGEDYKAMARDKRNIIQATWKQIRAKINVFKNIPEQYNEYLKNKNKVEGVCN